MDRAEAALPARLLRLLLCGLGVAAGLVLLGLAFNAVSASAAEPTSHTATTDPSDSGSSGSGLLGTVGSVFGTVTTPVSNTVQTVTSTVSSVVTPVTQTFPAPVQQAVHPVTDAVTTVTQSVSLTGTVAPVTDAVDDVVADVPEVGSTLSSTLGSLSGATAPVTGTIDGVVGDVGAVTGSVTSPSLPGGSDPSGPSNGSTGGDPASSAPGTSVDGTGAGAGDAVIGVWSARHAWQPAGAAVMNANEASPATRARASGLGIGGGDTPFAPSPGDPAAPSAVPGGSTTTSGARSGSGPGGSVLAFDAVAPIAPALPSALAGTPPDDRLPSTPTYETDSTPD
jgi:hypothetical protein